MSNLDFGLQLARATAWWPLLACIRVAREDYLTLVAIILCNEFNKVMI